MTELLRQQKQAIGFSIIIPTYNAQADIVGALDSIIAQTCKVNIEVIVVDDASEDNTVATVEKYESEQNIPEHITINWISADTNRGPGIVRDLGVNQAKEDWILFLDADDVLVDTALAALHDVVASNVKSDLIAFDWRYTDESKLEKVKREELEEIDFKQRQTVIEAYLLNRVDSSAIFHLYKRSMLLEHSVQFRGGYHEDVDYLFHTLLCANSIQVLPEALYLKNNRKGSIVNTLSVNHINGYFDAVEAMYAFLNNEQLSESMRVPFMNGVINIVASRLMRLIDPSIEKTSPVQAIVKTILKRTHQVARTLTCDMSDFFAIKGSLKTKYQMIFKMFAEQADYDNMRQVEVLIDDLEAIKSKSWSCYDLQHSVFLAPGEVRTCCKRFYYKKQFKGDVAVVKFQEQALSELPYQEIVDGKNKLHKEINRDNSEECSGCPFLAFEDWKKPLEKGIQYLSLEYQTLCNMRCTYCSDTYYGGKPSVYEPYQVVKSMLSSNALINCEYIVWGGGEPTLDKGFTKVLQQIEQGVPNVKQRVITNATRYIPALAELMRDDRAFIVTSIDAGTEPTFKAIRKYNNFTAIWRNLKKYADVAPQNVIIKYILMPENMATDELDAFCELVSQYALEGCNFQISCDFRTKELNLNQAFALSLLYAKLSKLNVNFVFLDDLVWQRLSTINQETIYLIHEELTRLNLNSIYETSDKYAHIVVWGTGAQAKLLMDKTLFLKQAQIDYFVDPREGKYGTEFYQKPVKPSESLLMDDQPILIAAVQSAPFIYQDIQKLGISKERIIKGLVL